MHADLDSLGTLPERWGARARIVSFDVGCGGTSWFRALLGYLVNESEDIRWVSRAAIGSSGGSGGWFCDRIKGIKIIEKLKGFFLL